MKFNKYVHTGLRDKNGVEIKLRNIVKISKPAIEYQTHTGDNIPNGSYTEPIGIMIETKYYEVVFELGCFGLKDIDSDNYWFDPLFYYFHPDGVIQEYIEENLIREIDLKRDRDIFDNDYSEAKEDLKYLLEENKMTIDEFIHFCKIEIVAKTINHLR